MPLAVCATPIGNLDDVTLRVLAELREADVVLAEDTRHTRGLLSRHGIEARLLSYHEHNEATRIAELVPRLAAGERMALVSDAGLPGISDPGARLVRAALDAGVPVTVLPGPSAVETALIASGLASERYAFVGFLPRREGERAALWEELASCAVAGRRVRVAATARRDAAIARGGGAGEGGRGLPRADEAVRGGHSRARRRARRRGSPSRRRARSRWCSGRGSGSPRQAPAFEAVADLVAAGTPRRVAAEVVARLTDVSRNDLYRGSL